LEKDAFQLKRNQVTEYGREVEEQRKQKELEQKQAAQKQEKAVP
jgi:hypothetical protein